MDWGTRVSVGGGWKRPQAAPSPGGESGAAQHPRAAARPRHGGEGEGAEPEHQLHACSRLTARPRLQQPEPELQWVATTKLRGEGKMGRAQTPHPGRLGLATPLLRSIANTARAGLAAVRDAPLDGGPARSPWARGRSGHAPSHREPVAFHLRPYRAASLPPNPRRFGSRGQALALSLMGLAQVGSSTTSHRQPPSKRLSRDVERPR